MRVQDLIKSDSLNIDWEYVMKIPQFQKLENIGFNSKWHTEKDALEHVRMVTMAMATMLDTDYHSNPKNIIMMGAALFHDIGKGVTGKVEDGDWHFPHHASNGEKITRAMLWDEDFYIRESICALVRNHMKPLHFQESLTPTKDIITLSHCLGFTGLVGIEDLLALKTADCMGAKQTQEDNWIDQIHYMRSYAEEWNCLTEPYKFPNNYSKYKYFNDSTMEFPVELYDDTDFTVYVMIGLPGSGKDTWIKNYIPDLPTVCRDDIRTEIGIKGEKPMGNKKQESEVTHIFNERLLEYGRKKQSFCINNTNLRKLYRTGYQGMLNPYKPKYIYVYVQAPSFKETLKRREGTIPPSVIFNMRDGFEFPSPTEYPEIILDIQ